MLSQSTSMRAGFATGTPLVRTSTAVSNGARRVGPAARRSTPVVAGLGDVFGDLFNYESWAPKSARRWRLRQPPTEAELAAANAAWSGDDDEEPVDMMASLDDRVKQMGSIQLPEVSDDDAATRMSFEDVSDTDFSSALNAKISTIAKSMDGSVDQSVDEDLLAGVGAGVGAAPQEPTGEDGVGWQDKTGPMTGKDLRAAIYSKYGKTYDVSFVRRDMPGKTIVALNIMWIHMEQRSFPMDEEEYMDKMDGVCYILEALNQTEKVRSFLKLPPKPHMGLPARPIVGTAISIQFPDLTQEVINEWFSHS